MYIVEHTHVSSMMGLLLSIVIMKVVGGIETLGPGSLSFFCLVERERREKTPTSLWVRFAFGLFEESVVIPSAPLQGLFYEEGGSVWFAQRLGLAHLKLGCVCV